MVQSENDRVASLDSSTQFVYVKDVHKVKPSQAITDREWKVHNLKI